MLDPLPDSVASRSGIQRGDILLSLNGEIISDPSEIQKRLEKISGPLQLHLLRGDSEIDISLTPLEGRIGVYLAPNVSLKRYQYGVFSSLEHGMREVYNQIGFSFRTFGAILRTSFSDTATREEKQEATAGIG